MARISRINQDKEEHAYTFLHFKQMALILNILDILLAFSDNAERRECPDKPVRTPRERQKSESKPTKAPSLSCSAG